MADESRSARLRLPLPALPSGHRGRHDHPAGNSAAIASLRLSGLLALDLSASWGPAPDHEGHSRSYSGNELGNPLWGAPRIHGELLKLWIDVGQTTVAKYMPRHRRPPSQGWRTFLRNHADGIASIDLVIVPTITFRLLYGLVILRNGRRQLLSIGVTDHPTAEWIARQITDAFAWDQGHGI